MEGVISIISSRQQGWINLPSGLEVFFVPHIGNFIQGKEEATSVTFQLGFRHEGLVAVNVQRKPTIEGERTLGDDENLKIEQDEDLRIDVIEEINLNQEELNLLEEIKDLDSGNKEKVNDIPKLPGLTQVGKIDLGQIRDYRRKRF